MDADVPAILKMSDGVVSLDFFAPSDALVLREVDGDAEHRLRFDFPDGFVPSLEHSESVIARWQEERIAGTRFAFAVRSVAGGELLGGCELRPLGNAAANLSYWTYPRHRRRGVASRAVALACDVARTELRLRVVQVAADPDNIGSRQVAARNGFKEFGEQDGKVLYILDLHNRQGTNLDGHR
jgi:RimJ/RimL family protein N-acetyltransferase